MTKAKKQIVLFLFAFTLVFGVVAVLNTDYTFAASKPAKVTGLKVTRYSANKVKMTYKKAKRAKKYKIYRRIGTGSWKLVKTTKYRTVYFTQNQVDEYSWKVRAIKGKKKGKYSSIVHITLPSSNYDGYEAVNYGGLFVISSNYYDTESGYYRYKDSNSASHIVSYCNYMKNEGWSIIEASGDGLKYYQKFQEENPGDSVTWMEKGDQLVSISDLNDALQDNYVADVEICCWTKQEWNLEYSPT